MKPTIVLSIIFHNEEKVLPRLLNSVYPIIDHYVAIDSSCTDNSRKIIRDFFDAKRIPGEILNFEYDKRDFSSAKRNFAIQQTKDKAEFILWIDCDDELVLSDSFDLQKFTDQLSACDMGNINVKHANIEYTRGHFLNTKKNFYWEGVLHEVILCKEPYTQSLIESTELLCHGDGHLSSSQTQKEKYLSHAALLLEEVLEKNNARDVFYLAQSYKDAGEKEKAIEWYTKRLSMVGFYEEVYVSQLNIAYLKWELNRSVMEIADEFMKCAELDDLRAEHLYYLKQMYEVNNRPKSAARIGELLRSYKNPYPNRILFINPSAYAAV